MCDIFSFLWDQRAHIFFWKEKQSWSIGFSIKKHFYWVSYFEISSYDDNISQISQLTRHHMWKCDRSLKI